MPLSKITKMAFESESGGFQISAIHPWLLAPLLAALLLQDQCRRCLIMSH
jgi:hypothetical protein